MTIQNKVKNYCYENKLIDKGDSVLVGLSGGADSVCLLFMLLDLRIEFDISVHAVHVNHGIRGEEAKRDEDFCRELCKRLGVDFEAVFESVPDISVNLGVGLEEAARKVRYELLEKKACEKDCNKIAVAHHANDKAETFVFQLLRGSRLTGLSGIKAKNGNLIRPLLGLEREEIESYLSEIGQPFVTDSTNKDNEYTRNYIRNVLLPQFETVQPQAVRHISELTDYFTDVNDLIEELAKKAYDCGVSEGKEFRISIPVLKGLHKVVAEDVVYHALCNFAGRKKDLTKGFVEDIMGLSEKQTGRKISLKYGISARREYDEIILYKSTVQTVDSSLSNCNNCLRVTEICMESKAESETFVNEIGVANGTLVKYFDADTLFSTETGKKEKKDIICRFAEPEDVITIFEDGRSKKVFDVLKDAKIAAGDRNRVMVAVMGNEVLLIKGLRGSEVARVTEETKHIIKIEFVQEV